MESFKINFTVFIPTSGTLPDVFTLDFQSIWYPFSDDGPALLHRSKF